MTFFSSAGWFFISDEDNAGDDDGGVEEEDLEPGMKIWWMVNGDVSCALQSPPRKTSLKTPLTP